MSTKLLFEIVVLVVPSAADSVCGSLFNIKNFLPPSLFFG